MDTFSQGPQRRMEDAIRLNWHETVKAMARGYERGLAEEGETPSYAGSPGDVLKIAGPALAGWHARRRAAISGDRRNGFISDKRAAEEVCALHLQAAQALAMLVGFMGVHDAADGASPEEIAEHVGAVLQLAANAVCAENLPQLIAAFRPDPAGLN